MIVNFGHLYQEKHPELRLIENADNILNKDWYPVFDLVKNKTFNFSKYTEVNTTSQLWKNSTPKIMVAINESNALKSLIENDTTFECSSALQFLIMLHLEYYQSVELKYLEINSKNLLSSETFKDKVEFVNLHSCPHLPLQYQNEYIKQNLEVGEWVYVYGCVYWRLLSFVPDLMKRETSYQGENCIYIGDGKFISFWRYDQEAKFEIKTFEEIINTLSERGKQEYEDMPRHLKRSLQKSFKKIKFQSDGKPLVFKNMFIPVGILSCSTMILSN